MAEIHAGSFSVHVSMLPRTNGSEASRSNLLKSSQRTHKGVEAKLRKLETKWLRHLFSHLAHDDGEAITLSQNGYGGTYIYMYIYIYLELRSCTYIDMTITCTLYIY